MTTPATSSPKWIWSPLLQENQPNQYVEFRSEFNLETAPAAAALRISVDTNYAAWVNADFAGCGQFGDFPDAPTYSTLELTGLLKTGKNALAVLVHYCGVDHFSYCPGGAGLWYELEIDGRILAASDEQTLCRISPPYLQEDTARFNLQMGFTFHYDASREDGWQAERYRGNDAWQEAAVASRDTAPEPRPLSMLTLRPPTPSRIIAQGLLKRSATPGQTVAEQMQCDFLSARRSWELFDDFPAISFPADFPVKLSESRLDGADGMYVLVDLGREECGFPVLELHSSDGCVVDLVVGEHLDDLRVRASIGGRNFSSRYVARSGNQAFTHYLHRDAGRYLQLHITQLRGSLELRYAGLIPAEYPVTTTGAFSNSDSMCGQIWATSQRTLHLCMHEHYEDCPWREQALYANDSRNQMLCGYYAFEDYDFARVSLDLLARTTGEDGFQEICAPMKHHLTIPGFTMTWFLAMNDYLMYAGDRAFLKRKFPQMEQMLQCYLASLQEGLLPCPAGKRYWHFYDWAPGLDGTEDDDCTRFAIVDGARFDAPLNFLCILALQAAENVAAHIGEEKQASQWREQADHMKTAAHQAFWDDGKGAYMTYVGDRAKPAYAELTQSFAILAGVGDDKVQRGLRDSLMNPRSGLTPTTLSQSLYKFEALLQDASCGPFVADSIMRDWSSMLLAGATSFWETLRGGWDFHHAGSLCHGWSGIPVYLYGAYGLGLKPLAPGFTRLQINPLLGMNEVQGVVPTDRGRILIELHRADDAYVANLQIPEGTEVVADHTRAVLKETQDD